MNDLPMTRVLRGFETSSHTMCGWCRKAIAEIPPADRKSLLRYLLPRSVLHSWPAACLHRKLAAMRAFYRPLIMASACQEACLAKDETCVPQTT